MKLQSKYIFQGTLELKTALHIGGGRVNVSNTDSPIVRTPEGIPFIPGSSFKGVFRSMVEKLAVSLPDIQSCQLTEAQEDEIWKTQSTDEIEQCLLSTEICPTAIMHAFAKWKADKNEAVLVNMLNQKLCHTCQLFGSPYSASKIIFQDLVVQDWADVTQIRDGVVIDRDSERARDALKYDYEVLPPSFTFELNICVENPSPQDLGLTCLGLQEFVSEMAYLGGNTSRGLGNCRIQEDNFAIYELDLRSEGKEERLKKYLVNTKLDQKMQKIADTQKFLQEKIEQLFSSN